MEYKHLSAPECIADLYSLFIWIMPKSNHNYFGCHGLSEAFLEDMNMSLDLYSMQFGSCDPYHSIWLIKDYDRLWCKDIHEYEQKPSKKRSY